MKLTREESQALAFIGGMILISAAARFAGRPGPVVIEGSQVSIPELQASSLALMEPGAAAETAASLGWVNVNTATEAEIAAIPKVGAAAAAAVVAERRRLGALDLEAVRAIPGLKKAALEALAAHGSFGTWDDPARLTPPPGVAALAQAAERPAGPAVGQVPQKPTGQPAPARATVVRGRRPTPPAGPPAVVRRSPPQEADGPAAQTIPINEATEAELQRLPGVGPALAARIVAWRQANGRFRSLADLDAVPGIGPALLGRIGPLVRF